MDFDLSRTLQWDSVANRAYTSPDDLPIRDRMADAAKHGDWRIVFAVLDERPEWVNSPRPGANKRYAPLHQAAWHNAPVDVVERLLHIGAWRTLRNGAGHMPYAIAARREHDDLVELLLPEIEHPLSKEVTAALQASLHELITQYDRQASRFLRLPEIEVLTELKQPRYSVRLTGGWFIVELRGEHLLVETASKMDYGSGAQFRIDAEGIHPL